MFGINDVSSEKRCYLTNAFFVALTSLRYSIHEWTIYIKFLRINQRICHHHSTCNTIIDIKHRDSFVDRARWISCWKLSNYHTEYVYMLRYKHNTTIREQYIEHSWRRKAELVRTTLPHFKCTSQNYRISVWFIGETRSNVDPVNWRWRTTDVKR